MKRTRLKKEDPRRKQLQEWIKGGAQKTAAAKGIAHNTDVVRECTTHHHACDCREKAIEELCELYLHEHEEVKAFVAGFGKREQCECEGCIKARGLL